MKEIDELIEQHGGWPRAFQTEPAAAPFIEADDERMMRPRAVAGEASAQFEQGRSER
jgi:hypothetical protein